MFLIVRLLSLSSIAGNQRHSSGVKDSDLFQQWPNFLQTFSIGLWAFGIVLEQLACFGVDTEFVCHATILDIEYGQAHHYSCFD